MLTIRCSSTDMNLACSGSLVPTEHPYNPNNPEANEGTAGHAALAFAVCDVDVPYESISSEYGVDIDTLEYLVRQGMQAWEEVKRYFGSGIATEIGGAADLGASIGELSGTVDVMGIDHGDDPPFKMGVLDWKCGWHPTRHKGQLMGYAYLRRDFWGMPETGYITAVEVHVRTGEMFIEHHDNAALDAYAKRLVEQVQNAGNQYGPSDTTCLYCPRQNECQARADWLRGGVAALEEVKTGAVTRNQIGALYDKAKMVRQALAQYDKVLDAMLIDGPVPDGEGGKIVMEEKEEDRLVPSEVINLIAADMGTEGPMRESQKVWDVIDRAMGAPKGRLEAEVKANAPKGSGAKWWRIAMEDLRERGGIEKVIKRQKKHIKGEK